MAAENGYEIVPTSEAKALAAYLISLRADAPLYETPMTVPAAPAAESGTNARALPGSPTNAKSFRVEELLNVSEAAQTNAPVTNAPAK